MLTATKMQLVNLWVGLLTTAKAIAAISPNTIDDEWTAKIDGYWEKIRPFVEVQTLAAAGCVDCDCTEAMAALGVFPENTVGANGEFLKLLLDAIIKFAPIILPLIVAEDEG